MTLVRQNFAAFFRTLQILFFALLGGQLIALAVFEFLRRQPAYVQEEYSGAFSSGQATGLSINLDNGGPVSLFLRYGIPLLALGLISLAFYLHRSARDKARVPGSLSEKLLAYRGALLLKWAPLEAATLLASTGYLLSGQFFLLLLAAGCILLFVMQIPKKQQLIQDLELSSGEQALLDDPQAAVMRN